MLARTSQLLKEPVASIKAMHTGSRMAAQGTTQQAQGLPAVLQICVGARVMCTWNGWVSRGIVNGLKGIVLEIVYKPGESPPALPLVVFVACSKQLLRADSYDDSYDSVPIVAGLQREEEILGFDNGR